MFSRDFTVLPAHPHVHPQVYIGRTDYRHKASIPPGQWELCRGTTAANSTFSPGSFQGPVLILQMKIALNVFTKRSPFRAVLTCFGGHGPTELMGPLPPPFRSFHPLSPLLPSPPFPLEVGPLNPARGLGERCKLPQRGLGRSPSRNRIWCILALKSGIWCNNFNDFPENQLTEFRAI